MRFESLQSRPQSIPLSDTLVVSFARNRIQFILIECLLGLDFTIQAPVRAQPEIEGIGKDLKEQNVFQTRYKSICFQF